MRLRVRLQVAQGECLDSNINRSPSAYLYNPEAERAEYDHNTDLNMTVLKLTGLLLGGRPARRP